MRSEGGAEPAPLTHIEQSFRNLRDFAEECGWECDGEYGWEWGWECGWECGGK